ncbi:asparaginyl-tRNA synthetase [Atheta coriaria]|uniref:asparaginyl-tRNA synthetase n=1 Tax=Dalotia coriaria TaxID=877792 RepID=UPI0031F3B446
MYRVFGRSFSSFAIPSIKQLFAKSKTKETVTIKGWVKSLRKMKGITFLDISDGSTDIKLQVVANKSLQLENLTTGSSVTVVGSMDRNPKGQLEVTADDIDISGKCILEEGYPFAPRKTYTPEYVRQYLHLRSRTNKFASMLRIRDGVTQAIHAHLHDEGYINIHTPILTSNDCEGAGEVFNIQPESQNIQRAMARENVPLTESYFNGKVFLTVSGQLHLEAMAHGLSKVYTLGPVFRAENSRSRLHLAEFYMLELETAFVDKLEDLMSCIEKLIQNVTILVLHKYQTDFKQAQIGDLDFAWTQKQFPVITHDYALEVLKQNGRNLNDDCNFTKEDEIFLVKHCGNVPTFVINWPKDQKPFYMKECKTEKGKVAALDLLAPNVGEIVGGSLREDDYYLLQEKLPTEKLQWYLELRKFGGVPTAGFGLGFERYLQLLLGITNIKDTIPFPRWPHNCSL